MDLKEKLHIKQDYNTVHMHGKKSPNKYLAHWMTKKWYKEHCCEILEKRIF